MRKNSLRSQSPTLTPEELAKTQVLNLSDLEKVANYEKVTSKKPAMFIAIIGVMFISMGLLYPSVLTMMSSDTGTKKTTEEKALQNESNLTDDTSSQARVEDVIPSMVSCQIASPGNPDGTDTALVVNFNFENNQLKSFTKQFTANATVGNPIGPTTIQNSINGYKYFETVPIEGYQIFTIPTEIGYAVNVNVDLTKFNPQTLPSTHVYNHVTNVIYLLNTDKTMLVTELTTNGYICQ